jgi:DNA-binding NarL/FixJ family response regulator
VTEQMRADRNGVKRPVDLPDFGAVSLGPAPAQTMRILGMIRGGHTYDYILRYGHYHGTWSKADVDRTMRNNRVTLPDAPDPAGQHSRKLTSARTAVLTTRQLAVCHYLCNAQNDAEMAAALGVGLPTIRKYVNDTLAATHTRDRLELVVSILTGKLVPVQAADDDA